MPPMFVGDAHHRRDAQAVGVFVGEGGHGCCAPQSMLHAVAGLPGLGSAGRRASDDPFDATANSACTDRTYGANHTAVAASTKAALQAKGELGARLAQFAALKPLKQSKRMQT